MCSSDNKYNGNKQDMWFCLKLCVALYGDDTFTVLGRDHARVSRTLFTLNYHGRLNMQVHGGRHAVQPSPRSLSTCGVHSSSTCHRLRPLHPRPQLSAAMIYAKHFVNPSTP